MKFREKNFKPFLFFFSFLQTFLSLPISYTPPIHSDSLIDFKKTYLQQEILRKNQYLSKNFGIDFVSAVKNSPRNSYFSQDILQKSSIPISKIYDNNEKSNFYNNNNQYSSFPQRFLQNDAEITKSNRNPNFYYESNLRDYYTHDDFQEKYNPYELNSNSFNNKQYYGDIFSGKSEKFSLQKPSNLIYYQNTNKNPKNNNNFRFKEEILPKHENKENKENKESRSIEEIAKEIKSEIERKMLFELTSNFSRFSDNIHNLIQKVSQISNETMKSTEIEKKILGSTLTEKKTNENKEKEEEIEFLRKSFQEIQRNEREKQDGFNVSVIKDLINSQIESQFKRYFELVPKNEKLSLENKTIQKNQDKNENFGKKEQASFLHQELENEVIDKVFGEINKADKWELFDQETPQKNSILEYFTYFFKNNLQ